MIDFYVKDSCHTNIQWVLRWVSLLCMQTCWYVFHGCILVLSHKCDYRRQVPKRELHELACHLQTIHLSQMHVFNFINSKLIWKFTFNSKWNQFSYQNFRRPLPDPCCLRRPLVQLSKLWTHFIFGLDRIRHGFNHRLSTPTIVGSPSTKWTWHIPQFVRPF